ncbi:hypothetical protein L207DRAFT_109635 [Hyaloscypha variabilis F]|uniref:Uncharacterized protein n=1 Tax=Hyaloscypha variabilis (strain UAMH 11265 / GT02V1 / F) TaxID=1149755 RepID=A0A2J6R9Q8_HYAVF|nr:hypothetical protein L207DRAFT_109635 [Hyaloscypha variabilis F]
MATSSPLPVARRYSADELLYLRSSLPVVNCVVNKLNKHPDIASIVRLPEEAFRYPHRFTCESRSLMDTTNGQNRRQLSKGHVAKSSEDSEYQTIGSRNANRSSGEVKWNFRRRDASDHSPQPHSAPTGVAAQQSENFQRFYRAVVSPTHVRVTAGGRIVPNTRIPAPPLFEWNGEKLHFESRKTEGDQDKHTVQAGHWLHSAPSPPGFPPLIPGGFLSPYNLLPRTSSIAMATMPPQVQSGPLVANNQPLSANAENTAATQPPSSLPQPIKISPPAQFDQTKPFMYNGHVVYPVPPGFQPPPNALPVSMPMLGNPGFMAQNPMTPSTGLYPAQFPGVLAGLANPFMFAPGQQFPMGITNGMQSTDGVSPLAPSLPFMTPPMLSITELIKSQIQSLQVNLKQIEQQMVNGKHLDDSFLEHQRGLFASQISNLEVMLENQLSQEGAMLALRGHEHSGLGISIPSSKGNKVSSPTLNNQTAIQSTKDTSVVAQGTTSSTAESEATEAEPSNGDEKPHARSDSTTKTRLTIAAAKAPPFQPRSQAAIAQASQSQHRNELSRSAVASPTENVPFETQAQIEARLLARCSTDWGYGGFPNAAATTSVTLSRTQSAQEASVKGQSEPVPPLLQKSHTFHGETPTAPSAALALTPVITPNAVPYLVGKLPNGIPANQAKDSDFMYPRNLTQDEIRARYLYWGKAPRSVQSGLPKFDGKDFYPPSPVKQDARLAPVTPTNGNGATGPQMNFEKLFDSPGLSPRMSVSSERLTQYNQPSIPNQSSGFGSYSFQSNANGEYNGGVGDLGQQPQTPLRRPFSMHDLGVTPVTEDFSHLFLEHGVPGYKTSSPLPKNATQPAAKSEKEPVTPRNHGSPGESDQGFESQHWKYENLNTTETADNDASSTNSTVEFNLSPKNKPRSPETSHEVAFAERVENFRTVEQQTLFLQNMLKNSTQTHMASPALSGAVSSATAQGYLPQYRGSAAASLAPAMVNYSTSERDSERSMAKSELTYDNAIGGASILAANFLPENRPLNVNRLQRPTPPPVETMGAEEYMRYLTERDEADKKLFEKHYKNTDGSQSGTGPVPGSDW